jgi:hypothetical protein
MKTIVILFALATLNVAAIAQKSLVKYVLTNTDTLICSNITVRPFTTKCVLPSGEKIIVPNKSITAYSNHGYVMKKLPVYIDGKKTNKSSMMEFVANNNRIEVYLYKNINYADGSIDAIFSFYHNQKCIGTKTNPDIMEIKNFLAEYKKPESKLLTIE